MAYRKYGNKRYRKKKPVASRWQNYSAAAGQLAKDVSMLKSLVNVEFKNVERASTTNPSSSGYMTLLNGIAEGDDIDQCNGRSILIKSCYVKHSMKCNSTASTSYVRCILFWDK